MALVAGALAVLADPDLRAALVADDLRGHVDAVASEQHIRNERAAFVGVQAVDDERLAVANAVLLVADSDDCVIPATRRDSLKETGRAKPRSCAEVCSGYLSPTHSSACIPLARDSGGPGSFGFGSAPFSDSGAISWTAGASIPLPSPLPSRSRLPASCGGCARRASRAWSASAPASALRRPSTPPRHRPRALGPECGSRARPGARPARGLWLGRVLGLLGSRGCFTRLALRGDARSRRAAPVAPPREPRRVRFFGATGATVLAVGD